MTLFRSLLVLGLTVAALPAHSSIVDFDLSFGDEGMVQHDVGADYEQTSDVYVAPSGRIYVLASAYDFAGGGTTNDRMVVMRLKPDGALDTSFASGGWFAFSNDTLYLKSFGPAALLADEANGRIYLAGAHGGIVDGNNSRMAVARVTFAGAFDESFGNGGVAYIEAPPYAGGPYTYDNYAYRLTQLGDGSIVTMGVRSKIDADTKVALAKFSPSGVPDASFGGADSYGGFLVLDFGRDDEYARGVVPGPGGTLVIDAGSGDGTNLDLVVARLTSTGEFDPSFSGNGWRTDPLGDKLMHALAPRVAGDGTITIAGSIEHPGYEFGNFIVRYTAAGDRDSTFGTGGLIEEPVTTFILNGTFALHPAGKIVWADHRYRDGTGYDVLVARVAGSEALALPAGENSDDGGGGGGALGSSALVLLAFAGLITFFGCGNTRRSSAAQPAARRA